MDLAQKKVVLLFYKEFERDSYFKNDKYLKRIVRPVYHLFSKKQKVSGFYVWYSLLVEALRQEGYKVYVNNYKLALRNPQYPVGLVGYPHILDSWSLPNPAIIGPGFYDHPKVAPTLMQDPRYKVYILTCHWMLNMFKPYYGEHCVLWNAGMNVSKWPDTSKNNKPIDVLIYDKIRWDRDKYEPQLLQPIIEYLMKRNLSYQIIRYKKYDYEMYRKALNESKSMIFLCEHETQGMAYQEALTSNVPILAWENGFWLDPRRPEFDPEPVPATSVPYFSPKCGERFKDVSSFPTTFDQFWSRLHTYQPRSFVLQELSLAESAKLYAKYYSQAGGINLL